MYIAIITFIIFFNMFSVILTVKVTKDMDTEKKIMIVVINEIVNFILMTLIYALSSSGVENEIHKASKWLMIFTFLPVNAILSSSLLASLFNKVVNDEISEEKFKKLMVIRLAIILVFFIIEIFYLKNVQVEISRLR